MKKNEVPEKLERDPDDCGRPKPKKWEVTFLMRRTVEVQADSAADAEEKARAAFSIDRDTITETVVGWVNPEREADPRVHHLEGCWGRHCKHYDCETGDAACDYREYCSQCDIEAY